MELNMEKSSKETKRKRYCICKSTDGTRFMICCDKCKEWFHGECVNITKRKSKVIKYWFCPKCRVVQDDSVVTFKAATSKKMRQEKKEKGITNQRSFMKDKFSCGQCSNCLQNTECGNKTSTISKEVNNNKIVASNKLHSINRPKIAKYSRENKRQCMGPNCIKPARINSKYCSDDCGLALNKLRIISILPHRIREMKLNPCVAYQSDLCKLQHLRNLKESATHYLHSLDKKEMKIHELISKAKRVPFEDVEVETREEDGKKFPCAICCLEIPFKNFMRHMELCFNKVERQILVVGNTKGNSEYCKIFCDFYDSSANTYCRRLRYLCPLHYTPAQAKKDEVCGSPIVENITQEISSETIKKFCQKLKKKCYLHVNWETRMLSEIDLSRMKEMKKLDSFSEGEATILSQMKSRFDPLGLLLHSTTVHSTPECN